MMASADGVLSSDRGEGVENEAYDEREQTSSGTTRRERARMIALDVTTFGLLFLARDVAGDGEAESKVYSGGFVVEVFVSA